MGSPLSKLVIGALCIVSPMIAFGTEIRRFPQQIPSALNGDEETEDIERRRLGGLLSLAKLASGVLQHHHAANSAEPGVEGGEREHHWKIGAGLGGAVGVAITKAAASSGIFGEAAKNHPMLASLVGGGASALLGGFLENKARGGRRLIENDDGDDEVLYYYQE